MSGCGWAGISKWDGGGVNPSLLETDDLEVGLGEECVGRVWRKEFGEGEGDCMADVRFVFCKREHNHKVT